METTKEVLQEKVSAVAGVLHVSLELGDKKWKTALSVGEAGVPGYDATSWNGIFAPARTPRPIIDKIHSEVVKVLKTPDVRERLIASGSDPVGSTPEEFHAHVKGELARWGKVIRDNNIRSE